MGYWETDSKGQSRVEAAAPGQWMGVREGTEEPALCKPFLKVTQQRIVITVMHFYNAFLWRFKML